MPKYRDPKSPEAHLYSRTRNGVTRYYGDFRDYANVGGGQESLKIENANGATTDRAEALRIAEARLTTLQALRELCPVGSVARTISAFAAYHMQQKAINDEADLQWMETADKHLKTATTFFKPGKNIARITVHDIENYVMHLKFTSNGRGGTLSGASIAQYLNSLSNLFRRAISKGLIALGKNPVSGLMTRPKIEGRETPWLEVTEAADALEYARTFIPPRPDLAVPYFHVILAVCFYTGLRESEVLGLRVSDVSLQFRT